VSKTLIVPLSGEGSHAAATVERVLQGSETVVFPLSHLANGGRALLRERDFDQLAVVGAPPRDEIGYAFATVVACVGRPRCVTLVDLHRSEDVSHPLARYLVRSAPFALAQLVTSAAALGLQGAALSLARARELEGCSAELRKLVYLRPAVGSTSGVGGSVTHAHEVIRALREAGVELEAVTTDPKIAETARRDIDPACTWRVAATPRATKAIPASAAAGGDVALVRAALPLARSADAIYQRHARFSLAGAVLARLTQRPLILEFNGSEVYFGRYWNPTPLQRRLARCEDEALRAATLIVVVSEVDRQSLLDRGIEPERILLNPNGVDARRFATGGGAEVRDRHGLEAGDFVIGFAGTFGSWHGAPVLARAFASVAAKLPGARLLLVGEGPELERTLAIVDEAGVADRVTSTGAVAPGEVPAHLDACDLLASPHVPLAGGVQFFGSPTKLFEYMAAGKPIVASRLGQIGDILDDGETALLVEPGSADELAAAVLRLAGSADLRQTLGSNARRVATERHSWQENARRLVDAYERVCSERSD
jgi:glycosyltransferase involved in cell wall biosynthesis